MAARWRSMTHTALRNSAPALKSIATVHQTLTTTLGDALLWTGMETDAKTALEVVSKASARLQDALQMMVQLMTVIAEEMATANYYIEIVSPVSGSLSPTLGLSASVGSTGSARVVRAASL